MRSDFCLFFIEGVPLIPPSWQRRLYCSSKSSSGTTSESTSSNMPSQSTPHLFCLTSSTIMCICVGIGISKPLEFTVTCQDFVISQVLCSELPPKCFNHSGMPESSPYRYPHTYSVSQPLPSPVYLYGIAAE